MELVTLQEATRHGPRTLMTMAVTLLFVAIFLFGGWGASWLGLAWRRRFLSFAAGLSVSYVFVHVLPALSAIAEFHARSPNDIPRLFPEHTVYLWTMAGFLIFYGLQSMVARAHQGPEGGAGQHQGGAWRAWLHIGSFALYAWVLMYMMVRTEKGVVALCAFAVAMGMHIVPVSSSLRSEYPSVYGRRGGLVLALASLAGWACGLTLSIPSPIMLNLVALVVGGVIINAAIVELPNQREGRYWSFLTGATSYTAVLLVLSHFE